MLRVDGSILVFRISSEGLTGVHCEFWKLVDNLGFVFLFLKFWWFSGSLDLRLY